MASLISVGQVLDLSLEHCRKHFKELLAITLWMVVASIPTVVGTLLAPSGGDQTLTGGDWLSFAFSCVGTILTIVVSIWAYATLVLAVAEQAGGKKINLKHTYQQGWKIFLPYFLLSLLVAGIVIGIALIAAPGFILLILSSSATSAPILGVLGTPVFIIGTGIALFLLVKYSVQIAFAPYVLILEKKNPIEAIKGSLALVRGRWWATLLRFLLPKLIYSLVIFVVNYLVFAVIEVVLSLLMETSTVLVLAVYTLSLFLSVFLSAIVIPLLIATDYYLYDSLRKTR